MSDLGDTVNLSHRQQVLMYGFEEPQTLKPDRVASFAICPAIDGIGTKMPDANLVRWKAVHESPHDWHKTEESSRLF